jgi:hypothetical protein
MPIEHSDNDVPIANTLADFVPEIRFPLKSAKTAIFRPTTVRNILPLGGI